MKLQIDLSAIEGPHAGQAVTQIESEDGHDPLVMILIHGRGASAESILGLGSQLKMRSGRTDLLLVAPQAAGSTWYPYRFIAPTEENQPWLDSARAVIETMIAQILATGVPTERLVLAGFSQGACLVADAVSRRQERFGGAFILSGGLIGPLGTEFAATGALDGTPVFVGCSDVDQHIPLERVNETSAVLRSVGARVDERIYPGMPHTVVEDELEAMKAILAAIT